MAGSPDHVNVPVGERERAQILEAIFDFSREEIVKRVKAGTMTKIVLSAHDYLYDIFA